MSTGHSVIEEQKTPTNEERTSSEMSLKTNANGVILIPQPSDDSRDPLVSLPFHSLWPQSIETSGSGF